MRQYKYISYQVIDVKFSPGVTREIWKYKDFTTLKSVNEVMCDQVE